MSRRFEAPEVEIIETEEVKLRQPLVIAGFVGAGLVGSIAVDHLIAQLGMKDIAYVRSRYLPPTAVFVDGRLRHPFRVYAGSEGTLCAVVCEIPLRSEGLYPISSALLDWAEKKRVKEIVVLEGIPIRGIPKKYKPFCVAEVEKCKELKGRGIEMLSRGFIGGIAGGILSECLMRKITGTALLVPATAFMPDPEGASTLVRALNDVYDLKIDPTELLNKAVEVKGKLKEIANQYQRMRSDERKRRVPESMIV